MNFSKSYEVFTDIFEGKKTSEEIEDILRELSSRGETFEEIAGAAKAMKEHAIPVSLPFETFDVCGTGGSNTAKTFNISTTVAIILASADIKIAKHGNRAASSKSGSADVLEALGIKVSITPKEMEENIKKNNLSFLFAQILHPKMKEIMPIRKKIGTRTIFNLLGPLTNPSNPSRQVVGVSDKKFLYPIAKALCLLEKKSAIVLWGEDGLDEATIRGKTYFITLNESGITKEGFFTPEEFGLKTIYKEEKIEGGTPEENAKIITSILKNEKKGYEKDIVLFNAGIAFWIAEKTSSIKEGINLAEKQIASNDAYNFLKTLV